MLKHWSARIIIALAAVGLLTAATGSAVRGQSAAKSPLPSAEPAIGFIPNGGQWDEAAAYHAAPSGVDVWLKTNGFVYAPGDTGLTPGVELPPEASETPADEVPTTIARHVVTAEFEGASEGVTLDPAEGLPGEYNWLVGPESDWVTGLHAYRSVTYRGLWSGIDATVRTGKAPAAVNGALAGDAIVKWTYTVAPGGDASQIKLRYTGQDSLAIENGVLKIGTQLGDLAETGLIAWQVRNGERLPVDAAFTIDGNVVGFAVGAYDPTLALVIDPVIIFSRRFGGSSTDSASNMSVDGSGSIYNSGMTASTNFPTQNAYQAAANVTYDCFVTKLNADSSALTYSTYLGGSSTDYECRHTLTPAGEVVVTATAAGTWVGVPILIGTPSGFDANLAILGAAGNTLTASAEVGGTSTDYAHGITRMSNGNIVVVGTTSSSAGWPALGGADISLTGQEAYAVVLNPTISGAVGFSYVGGNSSDWGNAVAVDASNNVYVHYSTLSTDIAMIAGGGGNYDLGVAKLNAGLTAFAYQGRVGGSSTDPTAGGSDTSVPGSLYQIANNGILVDGSGQAWTTGMTASTDWPTTAGAYKTTNGGNYDAFVTGINAAGTGLVRSTYIGGTSTDTGRGLGIDGTGRIYMVGSAASSNYPTTPGEVQTTFGGSYDWVRTIFQPDLSGLVCSTYLGGSSTDYGADIEVTGNYKAILNGSTASANFPQVPDGSTVFGGGGGYDIANAHITCGGANLVITNSALTNRGSVRTSVSPIAFPDGDGAEPMAVQPPAAPAADAAMAPAAPATK